MNKKGFTLIELIATIVVLSIVLLIVVMSTTELTKNAEKSAAEKGVQNYFKAIATKASVEKMKQNPLDGEYIVLENGNLCPINKECTDETDINIDMNGEKPNSGNVYIHKGRVTTESTVTIGNYIVSYDSNNRLITRKVDEIITPCKYTKDKDGYQMVTCGTESFYIIEYGEETVTMLTQYNIDLNTKRQSKTAGTIAFSSYQYWSKDDAYGYVYNSNSNLYSYVNAYGTYLKNLLGVNNVNATLMSYEQASTFRSELNPGWLYNTSYWVGNCYYTYWIGNQPYNIYIFGVSSGGGIPGIEYNNSTTNGIRPIVTIPKDKIS